jgi:hypothetical protein
MSESTEQQALFEWAEFTAKKTPELRLLFAVPNGGKRNITTAAILKREGVKSGVPDICLPVPRNEFHGLYIEMKFGKNKPTENQLWWIEQLRRQGYRVEVCYGWSEAVKVIVGYMTKG